MNRHHRYWLRESCVALIALDRKILRVLQKMLAIRGEDRERVASSTPCWIASSHGENEGHMIRKVGAG